jgi:hypothetical protein
MPRLDVAVSIVQEIKTRKGLSSSELEAVDEALGEIRAWSGGGWICINRLYDILDQYGIRKFCGTFYDRA